MTTRILVVLAILAPCFALGLASPTSIRATGTFTVNSTDDAVDANPGDGTCAADGGTCTLRAAIQESNALPGGDLIQIPAGTYKLELEQQVAGGQLPPDTIAANDLDVTDTVAIHGAGEGVTFIDGNHIDRVFDVKPATTPISVTMTDMTVQNGLAINNGSGGGLLLRGQTGTSLSLSKMMFTMNQAQYGGGIEIADQTTALLDDVRIVDNKAAIDGGGINVADTSDLHVFDSAITENKSDSGGGFINTQSGTVTIAHSTIDNNFVDTYGGGVFTGDGGTTTITDTSISDNTAEHNGGGGVYAAGGALTMERVTIANNSAGGEGNGGGGVQQDSDGTIDIKNSTIANNTSDTIGGGIFIQDMGPATVTNTTISGNSPEGIYLRADGPITLTNTIIANNGPHNCGHDSGVGDLRSGGHNLADDTSCSLHKPGDLVGDPMLGSLADNGGPTMTMALSLDSPAIDAGDNNTCEDLDQRGAPRPFDGNGDTVATCDIGAFEFGLIALVFGDFGCDGSLGALDALAGLTQISGIANISAAPLCPGLQDTIDIVGLSGHKWGDLNCDDTADAADIPEILRYLAGLPTITQACPVPGENIFVTALA